jgi:predicted amidohydrolase
VAILVGSLPIRTEEGGIANRSYLISGTGAIDAVYDKIHMFDVQLGTGEVYRESDTFTAGRRLVLGRVAQARLGLTVCYDVRFPHLYRDLAKAGAEVLVVPSAFTRVTGEAHWHTLLRARAIETGSFVIAPAQGGRHEDGRETYGHSLIIDPWGRILAEKTDDAPGLILADLDLALVADARRRIPALNHDRAYTAD